MAGNLTRFDKWDGDSIQTVAYLYNGANQIQCIDTNADSSCAGEVNYSYDAYGNLLSDGVTTYTYDAAMRLTSTSAGGVTTSYTYNGDGGRISQSVQEGQTQTTTTYTSMSPPPARWSSAKRSATCMG